MHSRVTYRWVRTTAELKAFLPEWRRLWQEDENATPFQSPEWLLPWWRQFGDQNLRALAILHDGAVSGFLPFYVYEDQETSERQLLLLGVATSDYLDGLFASHCGPEDIQGALELLRAEGGGDSLYVSQLRVQSKLYQALDRLRAINLCTVMPGESCSRMAAVTMSDLPQKIRRNAMYYRNCALRAGPVELDFADSSNWQYVFDTLQRLHSERWRSRGEDGVLADPRVIAWHREALPLLERAGLLRLCALSVGGPPVGVLYSLLDPPQRRERTQYFYLPAFSIEHAELRPGTVLTAMAIEAAAREGVRFIDMLRGEEDYKRMWHMERVPTFAFFQSRKDRRSSPDQREIAA